ncbi:hypothetical protein [Hymenobacter cellulosilyticus]|uniref:Outer membrane protein beta-barrel domain-containing protein n=1 Tax=Hymenobacter cellulosilyticus TaxID=2932248 RepID=A0A8T9Q4C6_9BACT|nr:hypothetical protein [Hymenobacter cellulosilyticus]UOQ72347.1 hypothetical protein MUN79_28040 [Hymenobacter cellulosilyticus]
MRTPDMSDEELDALFQRSAENYPDEHNLSAWLQMERKLDEAAAGQLVRQKVVRIFALETVVLLLALLGWLSYSNYSQQPQAGKAARQTPASIAATPGATPTILSKPESTTPAQGVAARRQPAATLAAVALPSLSGPEATPAVSSPAPVEAALPNTAPGRTTRPARSSFRLPIAVVPTRKPNPAFQTMATAYPTESVVAAGPSAGRSVAHPAALTPAAPERSTQVPAGLPAAELPVAPTFTPRPEAPVPASVTPDADKTVASAPVASETAVAAALQPGGEPLPDSPSGATPPPADSAATAASVAAGPTTPLPAPAPADSVNNQKPKQPARTKPAYRLSIGGLYAPELSTVGWTTTTSPGSNLGIVVEYRFTNRLRLNVAAIRSVKRYVARGSDYTVPAGTWDANYTIDQVGAVCRITDLPINLRYDVLNRENMAVFVSAGLTSLLMRDEQYAYDYEYYGKYYTRDWNISKGSNHFLSVVNLSAGYERSLANRWSVQGEPFVKVPLGGVGFGKVKLSSAGVFFSLKYHLLPTR